VNDFGPRHRGLCADVEQNHGRYDYSTYTADVQWDMPLCECDKEGSACIVGKPYMIPISGLPEVYQTESRVGDE
jgi:hypothetical protein